MCASEPNAPLLYFIPIATNRMVRLHHVVVRDYHVDGKNKTLLFGFISEDYCEFCLGLGCISTYLCIG